MKRILAGASLLLLSIEPTLGHSIPSIHKRDETSTTVAQSTCRPPLPNLLLQQSPPSADDEILKPLFLKVQAMAAATAATDGVDSISVGIVGPQGLLWHQGFGKAKANGTDDTPPNEHTIYRLGSISKLFAAMEGFVLQDKGYLNWEDPAVKHVPSLTYPSQGWKEFLANNRQPVYDDDFDPITLRNLASHTSGIARDLPYNNNDQWPDAPSTPQGSDWPSLDTQLQEIANLPLVAPPGSFPAYSNTAYSVLGEALAAANANSEGNRISYAELVKRDIFGPLAMNGSSFVALPENSALYAVPKIPSEVDANPNESFHAPGGQFSSVSDLSNAVRFLLNPATATGSRIIRASTLREWIRPSFPQYDNVSETGLVWEILKFSDRYGQTQRFYGKSGDLRTFHTQLGFSRDLQFGAVVLNAGKAVAPFVSRDALQILLPGIQSVLEQRVKERYAGSWKIDANPDDEIVVVVENGLLSITKWKVNGHDFLQLYEAGTVDRVSLWPTGRFDEFRIALGVAALNTDPLMGCFPVWATFDSMASKHVPVGLLYFEEVDGQLMMQFPSANATLHR